MKSDCSHFVTPTATRRGWAWALPRDGGAGRRAVAAERLRLGREREVLGLKRLGKLWRAPTVLSPAVVRSVHLKAAAPVAFSRTAAWAKAARTVVCHMSSSLIARPRVHLFLGLIERIDHAEPLSHQSVAGLGVAPRWWCWRWCCGTDAEAGQEVASKEAAEKKKEENRFVSHHLPLPLRHIPQCDLRALVRRAEHDRARCRHLDHHRQARPRSPSLW